MQRPYLVITHRADGRMEEHPMKEWLRNHPQHIPEGMDPDIHTSQQLRFGLKRKGWKVEETHLTVRLIFPAKNTNLRGTPDMRRHGKDYLVIIPGEGRYPMIQWLRDNPQHAPEGKDPNDKTINSQTWRRVLVRNGWTDEETDTEVRLFPPEERENTKTPSAIASAHETTTHKVSHSKGLANMGRAEPRDFIVIFKGERYPMMEWLRKNPEHIPAGMHPDTNNSHSLFFGLLQKNDWVAEADDAEIRLIFPTPSRKTNSQLSSQTEMMVHEFREILRKTENSFDIAEEHIKAGVLNDATSVNLIRGEIRAYYKDLEKLCETYSI